MDHSWQSSWAQLCCSSSGSPRSRPSVAGERAFRTGSDRSTIARFPKPASAMPNRGSVTSIKSTNSSTSVLCPSRRGSAFSKTGAMLRRVSSTIRRTPLAQRSEWSNAYLPIAATRPTPTPRRRPRMSPSTTRRSSAVPPRPREARVGQRRSGHGEPAESDDRLPLGLRRARHRRHAHRCVGMCSRGPALAPGPDPPD